ncbi:hypothetical protein P152DRAFT_471333 [Eremomyces bilateralis CBS 781.70]|uniref:Uncharacterized protein n=1 Tax=Eremomyces bilateralis CBS 781.70 TaxID=1392243 RepID=A0A6G1GD84_9PEZI|nr:uncharacterized protein P152DRAFT_471333 [Eremomyces bilateralis CBS 781.70]KAF1815972.1 hypothetical protein P152DRAFT_471333 [Eremomyces bilateralis CBS 781.70]
MAAATTTPASTMSSTLASAAGTSGLQLNGRPRVPPLKTRTPMSATYPSELRSPLHSASVTTPRSSGGLWSAGIRGEDLRSSGLSPALGGATIFSAGGARTPTSAPIKREWEDDSANNDPTVITPPPAYLDFLRALKPGVKSPVCAAPPQPHSARGFGPTSASFTSGGDGKGETVEFPDSIPRPQSLYSTDSSDSVTTTASLSTGSTSSLNMMTDPSHPADTSMPGIEEVDPIVKTEPATPESLNEPDINAEDTDITPTATKRDESRDQEHYRNLSPPSRSSSTSSVQSIGRPPPAVVSGSQPASSGPSPGQHYQLHRPANIQIPSASQFMRNAQTSYVHTPGLGSGRQPQTPSSATAPKGSATRRARPGLHIPNSGKSVGAGPYSPAVSGTTNPNAVRSPISAGIRSPLSAGVRSPLPTGPGAPIHSPAIQSPVGVQSPLSLSGALTGPLGGSATHHAPSPTCVSVREVVTRTVVWARGPGQSNSSNGSSAGPNQAQGRDGCGETSERREAPEKRRRVED